jgi:hypothetical protein
MPRGVLRIRILMCKVGTSRINITAIIKSWKIVWTGHEARKDELRKAYYILFGKSEGKRVLA